MDSSDWSLALCLILWGVWCYGFGYTSGTPDEIDNGCLVYNDKIYCEEVSK